MRRTILGQVAKINPSGPRNGELPGDELVDFVPMAAVSESGDVNVNEQRTAAEVSKGFTAFQNDDVLVAKITPCFENNKIALAKVQTRYAFGSTEFHVIRCSVKELDPNYLTHFLRQDRVRNEGEKRMTGSAGQRRVPKAFLEELEIPLPPLDEQRRIAAILDQADTLRRLRQRAIDRLNELGQGIFYEMFGEPESTRYPTQQLESVSELINGDRSSNYPSGDDLVEEGILFLSTKNIDNGEVKLSECNFITPKKFDSLSRGKLRRHDLIITLRGTLGQCAEFNCKYETGFINAQMMIIRAHECVRPKYLHAYLSHPRTQALLQRDRSGSAVPQLTGKQVGQLIIPVPPIAAQDTFASRVAGIQHLARRKYSHKHELENLFSSLQFRAFQGEL